MQLEQLHEAIRLRSGPAIVTGVSGSGKTRLCGALAEPVHERMFTALILDPIDSAEDLLARILQDFGVLSKGDSTPSPRAAITRRELFDALVSFLGGLVPIDATAVLIVDDAQNLSPAVLAQIASLADLELNRQPLLQVVLVGTPVLPDLLRAPEGSALDQGVSIRCELEPAHEILRESPSWLQRRVSPLAAVGVVLLASVLAVGVGAIVYEQLGF